MGLEIVNSVIAFADVWDGEMGDGNRDICRQSHDNYSNVASYNPVDVAYWLTNIEFNYTLFNGDQALTFKEYLFDSSSFYCGDNNFYIDACNLCNEGSTLYFFTQFTITQGYTHGPVSNLNWEWEEVN